MTVKYGKFELPKKNVVEEETATSTFARVTAEPFERGFGHTIGNSMRRVMLTSLESPAIIAMRIEGVPHEYMAIEGVVEDMTNIILNLKGALLRHSGDESSYDAKETRILTTILEITQDDLDQNNGEYDVTLGDVITDTKFEIVNPNMHLFTVTVPFKRQIDLRVAIGRGYVPSERHQIRDLTVDEILIDAAFSPVRLVNYYVENTRVGQDTDFDRLILEVTTDGRVTPIEAISYAAQICQKHFAVFEGLEAATLSFEESLRDGQTDHDEMMDKLSLGIDEIELSVRSTNCLKGANIDTIAELVLIPEKKMLEFRNFGKKSLNEIKAKLTEMSLYLGMDLNKFGITTENVRSKVKDYREHKKGKREFAADVAAEGASYEE